MSSEDKENNNSYVFTDSYRTKDLIWDAYYGYVETYNNYVMYSKLKRKNPTINAGLDKYANSLYHEIVEFLDDFKKDLIEKDIIKLKELFKSTNRVFSDEDYLFMRKFFNRFMVKSGIKAIVKQKDTMGEFAKSQSRM